ncbi:MAG: alpha/beta hydrolase [Firmicutes bacterium]|nr:alpha/beta hydrolase [Bacillota bacterium]
MNSYIADCGLVRDDQYAETMRSVVDPYLAEHGEQREIICSDGAKLYALRYRADEPRGTVMLLHGFTENAYKFSEVIFGFLQNGWNVVVYDQRGHGRSSRDARVKDLREVNIDRFGQYVEDLRTVYQQLMQDQPRPWVVWSHSMGGAVAALALEEQPDAFDKAVFSSPMIAPSTGGFPVWVGKSMCYFFKLIGKAREHTFLSQLREGREAFENSCATDIKRFDWYEDVRSETPEFQTCAPTYNWTLEAMRVTPRILAKGKVEKIQIPVRVYSAALDNIVQIEPQKIFASRLPHGEFVCVADAKHEIYRSEDKVLFPYWEEMLHFMEQ